MSEQNKEMKNGGSVTFDGTDDNVYVITLKKKKFPWWVLLLLLPLLLLIRCNRDIEVKCLEGSLPAVGQTVNLSYVSHFLFKGGFLTDEPVSRSQTTDNGGNTVFKDLPCSVWSYLFHRGERVNVNAAGTQCFASADTSDLFHSTDEIDLALDANIKDVTVRLTDIVSGEPLANGTIEYILNGKTEKATVNPDGTITIKNVNACANITFTGSCDEHYDSTAANIDCGTIADAGFPLPLRPIKKIPPVDLQFTNIDSINLKPIAGVSNKIIVKDPDKGDISTTAVSKSNGTFTVTAKPGSRIEITSDKDGYKSKFHVIASFDKPEKVKMQPIMETLTFRTVKEEDWSVLSSCNLKVTGSVSGTLKPDNSGTGTFSVTMRKSENLSITASKSGFSTNSTKVKNNSFAQLNVNDAKRRDIPLKSATDLKGQNGDLRINLQWYCKADLDLIVKDPCGNFTFYNRKTTSCSGSRGKLDIDANQNATNEPWKASTRPQENIFWTNPAAGTYTIAIVCCPFHPQMNLPSRRIDFTITIEDSNGRIDKRGTITENDSLTFTTYKYVK